MKFPVDVFAYKDTTRAQMGQEFLQCGCLLMVHVPPIVYDDAELGHFRAELTPEGPISLVAR